MATQYEIQLGNELPQIEEPAEILSFPGKKTDASIQQTLASIADTPEGFNAIIDMACKLIDINLKRTRGRVTSPDHAERYFKARLGGLEHEAFAVLFMDMKHNVLGFEVMFHGSIGSAVVHAREVVKAALKHNAAAVIIGHNHPSGDSEPSEADIRMTRTLHNALELIEVRLLDHLVVGYGSAYSFKANDLI